MKTDHHDQISEIVNSIRLLQNVGRQQSQEFIRKYGITGPQLGTLRIVAMSPGASLHEVSDRMYLHISTVSTIVDRLVKRGYVKRERRADDRRMVCLNVTAAGKTVIRKTPLAGMGLLIHNINQLPSRDRTEIQKGLRRLLDFMKIKPPHRSRTTTKER